MTTWWRGPTTAVLALVVVGCALAWATTLTHGASEYDLFVPLGAALVVVGAFLTVRMPGNPIGRLLLAWGVVVSYSCWIGSWTEDVVEHGGTLGAGLRWAFLLVDVVWHPAFSLFALAILLFPHGRLLSRRWRPAAVLVVVWAVALAVAAALAPATSLQIEGFTGYRAPYTSAAERVAGPAFGVLLSSIMIVLLTAVISLIVRWVRSASDDRRQITVFVFPTSLGLVLFVVGLLTVGDGRFGFVVGPVIPLSLAVAVVRYRLYEIDTIVSRTVSYGIVTAVVVGVFVGSVQLVGLALPTQDGFAVAVATLAAVTVFAPLRRRVQRVVDRRFNRTRYDHERLVQRFRVDLRRADELPLVTDHLLAAVDAALQPATVAVWIKP